MDGLVSSTTAACAETACEKKHATTKTTLRWTVLLRETQKNPDTMWSEFFCRQYRGKSNIEVHLKLERVRTHSNRVDFLLALVANPPLDQRFGEHIALEHEVVVRFERVKRAIERAGKRRHVLQLFR